ncbi:MAG TPA: hypothetical protein ENN67_03760, partial [Firmicutes bacterium]|nr:hypothetical protein [Bacillota bacterium]
MVKCKLSRLAWLMMLLIAGCSSGGNPVEPSDISPSLTERTRDMISQTGSGFESGRYLWSYHNIYIDPSTLEYEVIPVRDAEAHWNILSFLEKSPCTYCFKVASVVPSGSYTLLLTVQMINPYHTPNITGFDVRGIAMFDASHLFPKAGLKFSDRSMGDIAVVNPDGYTTLYNPTTAGAGPDGLQGYIKGNMASATPPNGRLNAFKRFVSECEDNKRNAFYADDIVKVTYEIAMPATGFSFGYAVDANWAMPIKKPVTDPMADFGPEANCPEAWMIRHVKTEKIGSGMTDCGGQAKLTFDIFDWQGVDHAHLPRLECPELFYGEVEAIWKGDGSGFSRYEAVMENVKHAPAGSYYFLIRKEAKENDPVGKPWLDLRAYHVFEIEVFKSYKQPPVA